jgi:DNA adenine methylase
LIATLDAISKGWLPPDIITEDIYACVKNNKDEDKALAGYVGFAFSFGGKWFGGYRRDIAGSSKNLEIKIENEITQSRRSYSDICKQANNIQGVKFIHKSYSDIKLNQPCIIYCDPPYAGTTKYRDEFHHDVFWNWCRNMESKGHNVFISEYNAPDDFECVLEYVHYKFSR